MADGVAEGEKFAKGEDGDDGGGDSDGPGWSEEDDADDDGDEDERGEDALPSHRERRVLYERSENGYVRKTRIAEKENEKKRQAA